MEALIKQYKETGDFTTAQKAEFFIKPSKEVLDMILTSDDFNFRKTCLNAFLDFNVDIVTNYGDFIKNPVVVSTLGRILNR